MAQLLELLRQAHNPVAIVGGSRWKRRRLWPASRLRRRPRPARGPPVPAPDAVRPPAPCYAATWARRTPEAAQRIRAADLLCLPWRALSCHPGTYPTSPRRKSCSAIAPDPDELGRVYQARSCPSTPRPRPSVPPCPRRPRRRPARTPPGRAGSACRLPGLSDPAPIRIPWRPADGRAVMQHLRAALPVRHGSATARATSPPGTASGRSASSARSLAPTSGSIASWPGWRARSACGPSARWWCLRDDGDFMHGQEFATAVQYRLPIIVVLLDKRYVRHHPHAPGARVPALRQRAPPRTRISRSTPSLRRPYGERVERTEDSLPWHYPPAPAGPGHRPSALLHCLIDLRRLRPPGR